MERPLMSLKELAKYLGISKVTLYRYIKNKKIPAIKIGRFWKFKKAKIDAWVKERER